ncbi:hypothetical protein JOF56_009108 [Kibdelosporangium banguiense]|uniref:Uncharacterized protein n=1 Tax=Kibdelosporangium banguiense TaxID=1365924 RepID=A0ABS4TWH3_9PSEU|nr:hypothetical protein [Kibdelosporangium banguiense]MBP2328723.1 hypothetical protein [Kibdelosporangium banguiense]
MSSGVVSTAHFLAAGLPEHDLTAMRPGRFAAATYPLHGMLGEHLYARLHPGGEIATEVALFVSAIPEELTAKLPTALSLELLAVHFPILPTGVIPDEITLYPLPFPAWVAPLEALDHGDVVAHRAVAAAPQVLRAWLSTSND